uniref:Movement protein TGB2 n=1 Tax=Hibiscus chlorotic speck associated virus 2 TaxID=3143943 RepID=A0AAU7L1W5_9VIRU
MPLSPPPDHSKAVLVLVIGVSLGVIIYFLTSYKGPSVGDNIHNLPFGGFYQDGTKKVIYNSPAVRKKPFSVGSDKTVAFVVLLIVSFLIYVSERVNSGCRGSNNCVCSTHRD